MTKKATTALLLNASKIGDGHLQLLPGPVHRRPPPRRSRRCRHARAGRGTDSEHSASAASRTSAGSARRAAASTADWRLPAAAGQTVDSGGSEISSQPNALTPTAGPASSRRRRPVRADVAAQPYLVTTIASYPEDCTVCVQRDDHGGPWTCGVEVQRGVERQQRRPRARCSRPSWARRRRRRRRRSCRSPSSRPRSSSSRSLRLRRPVAPAHDPNLGTVPMCCDVGMLRDEDGTPFAATSTVDRSL